MLSAAFAVTAFLALLLPWLFSSIPHAPADAVPSRFYSFATALEAFKQDFGTYPDSLQTLQQYRYLQYVGKDPWNRPYVYLRTPRSARGFLLYSRGPNGLDDKTQSDDLLYAPSEQEPT